jgi:hypothetical protein
MAAKKTSSKKRLNKSEFVRSLPASTPGADVVKKAKEAGIGLTIGYVYSIRAKTNAKKREKTSPADIAPATKRGPGRPRKIVLATNGNGSAAATHSARSGGGLEAAIEAIVERKVAEILKGRLGSLFG